MSFDPIETSNDDGNPARAYEFRLGSAVWRYVSAPEDVVMAGFTWKAAPISDDGVKLTGEATTDALTITGPDTIGPAKLFMGTPPSGEVYVTIYMYHQDDKQLVVEYVGSVSQADWPQPGTATLACESLFASMERDGLRYGWQRACPYALYDPRSCRAEKADFAVTITVTGAANGIVTSPDFATKPPGYFNGGFCTWEHPVRGTEFRGIEEHAIDQVRMFGTSDGMYTGLVITAYPGCNRGAEMCNERFDNLDNYGGVLDMPDRSPFDGNPVFI